MSIADYQNCRECRTPLLPDDPNTYVRIEGWQKRSLSPSRRGGADVVLRQPVDPAEYLCSGCAHALKAGVAPLQESLLGVGV
jgi:hypothetical protein